MQVAVADHRRLRRRAIGRRATRPAAARSCAAEQLSGRDQRRQDAVHPRARRRRRPSSDGGAPGPDRAGAGRAIDSGQRAPGSRRAERRQPRTAARPSSPASSGAPAARSMTMNARPDPRRGRRTRWTAGVGNPWAATSAWKAVSLAAMPRHPASTRATSAPAHPCGCAPQPERDQLGPEPARQRPGGGRRRPASGPGRAAQHLQQIVVQSTGRS